MQAGAAVANATNKAAGLSASTPEPGAIISAIQLVNGGRTIGPEALAHFTESVRNKLLSLLVSMEPIQSGAGDPSPDNVRPISGRTGLTIYVSPTPTAADATTYAVDWTSEAGTVYGGTLDVVTGVLTVDKRYITFSSGAILYGNFGDDNAPLYYIDFPTAPAIKIAADSTDDSKLQCNYFTYISTPSDVSMKDCEIRTRVRPTPDRFYFRWDSATDASSINAALANNPLQVVADLQSPLTYQLTGTDIVTLVGDNYIWSDSGDVTITE